MQESREKQRTRTRDLRREARRKGKLLGELAARQLAQPIDRGHRMNVDRVHVVNVVVHPPRHGEKLRHHREQEADLVELADDRPAARSRLRHRANQVDEDRRGIRACPQTLAPRGVVGRPSDGVTGKWENGGLVPHARLEDAHRERRLRLELGDPGDRHRPVE